MQKWFYSFISSEKGLYLASIITSFFLSFVIPYNRVLNLDGILYVRTADTFLKAGWEAASYVYNYPFYPALIAYFSTFLHLPLQTGAYTLNAGLSALLVVSFIVLIKQLGGTQRIQMWGAITILVFASLNYYRDYVIRDMGHWAFLLLSLCYFMAYAKNPKWYFGFGWLITILIATAFRMESVFVIPVLPWILLFDQTVPLRARFSRISFLLAPLLFFMILGGIKVLNESTLRFVDLQNWIYAVTHSLPSIWQDRVVILSQYLFPEPFKLEHVSVLLAGGFTVYTIFEWLSALTPLFFLFFLFAVIKKSVPASRIQKLILISVFCIYSLELCLFLLHSSFLTRRYMMPLALIALLWVPFGIQTLMNTELAFIRDKWKKTGLYLLFLGLFLDSAISLKDFNFYIKEAGSWIASNTPETITLYTNSKQVAYYAKREGIDWKTDFEPNIVITPALVRKKLKTHSYIALLLPQEEFERLKPMFKQLHLEILEQFIGKRRNTVVVIAKKVSGKGVAS